MILTYQLRYAPYNVSYDGLAARFDFFSMSLVWRASYLKHYMVDARADVDDIRRKLWGDSRNAGNPTA